jgi:hypothetical protein
VLRACVQRTQAAGCWARLVVLVGQRSRKESSVHPGSGAFYIRRRAIFVTQFRMLGATRQKTSFILIDQRRTAAGLER